MKKTHRITAKINSIKRWSPVWIIPIVTMFIGIWIIATHIANQGKSFTLITNNADGIVAGKTTIKNRSVDVGVIESVTLSKDFGNVIMQARMKKGMDELLQEDTLFWIVKPQIGREGVSGLSTILSGAYIEVSQGQNGEAKEAVYNLLDQAPVSWPNQPGLRVKINSTQTGVLAVGSPVMFRGVKVGKIENAEFDPQARAVHYVIFVPQPYDMLVTKNVRFWQDSGFDFDITASGVSLGVPSLETLLGGGISFDIPEGAGLGEPAENLAEYELFANKANTQDSQYTEYREFMLLFSDSVGGLTPGAPVEFRGIRVGTVSEVPFYVPDLKNIADLEYHIPVLIKIELGRLNKLSAQGVEILEGLIKEQNNGLRGALKSANLITGALYVDLDFYKEEKASKQPKELFGYTTIPTIPTGLSQIRNKVMDVMARVEKLPLETMAKDMQYAIADGRKMIDSLNKLVASKEVKDLPKDTQKTLQSLNETLKGFQPGSDMHNALMSDIQRMEEVLRELKPVLSTLNDKSNALIFEAKSKQDPKPKAKRKDK